MSFIQIIEYETDRPDEVRTLGQTQIAQMPAPPGGVRVLMTRDRDKPNRYFTLVEFPSYEAAMSNSKRPETGQFASRMAELCTSGPTYHNLEVEMTAP